MASGKKAAAAAAKPAPTRNALESDSDSEQITEIKVNQKFAKEYTDRKRKEELTKLERQRAYLEEESDEDESESETEDEDAEELTREVDNDIKKTLRLIRNRDPIIYDSSVTFFKARESDDSGSESEGDTPKKSKKSEKKKDAPLYYKDLVRQQVIAGDVDSEEEDDESSRVMTYGEEQAKLKQDFLKSLKQAENENSDDGTGKQNGEDKDDGDGSDLEGGLFSVRTKTDAEQQLDDDEYEQFKSKYGTKLKKDTIDPEAFLENYLNGGWKEKKDLIPHYEDIVKEDEEDAEALEKMEEFEHAYNFRFEEEGSGLIQTYARNIEDSMRRKDDSRKQKREERKARKALERLKKEEELRRLKNLKQAEIQSKLEKIAKLVGKVSEQDRLQKVLAADLDGDFDPEEYDTRMQQLFDDEYYNENEDDGEAMEKPTWDDEEDKALFAGLPVEDEEEEEEEEEEVKPVIIEEEEEGDEEEDNGEEEMEEDAEDEKNMTPEELERAKQKYLDELYGLDYEDLIGDLQCRFKYREVRKNDFGLTADEIMAADDKDLKSLVSLKRLAPYLEEEYAVNCKKVKSFRKSLEEKQAEAAAAKKKKKSKEVEASDGEENETAADAVVPTKKRKRTKKNKQTANAVSEPEESTLQGDDGNEEPAEDEGTPAATHESIPTDETKAKKKKKQRRSKKKKDEPNPFASTGLSSSRLESYKLLKSKK